MDEADLARFTAALFRPVDLGPGGEIQFGD